MAAFYFASRPYSLRQELPIGSPGAKTFLAYYAA
jgi:hypothetical protein